MAELTIKQGDLFEHLERTMDSPEWANWPLVTIPHVCNNEGAWGAGFVLSLSKWWKEPEELYKQDTHHTLGDIQETDANNGVRVVNMIAQTLDDEPKRIRYAALGSCMFQVAEGITARARRNGAQIWCPKFGSGLAGGNWILIQQMIEETWVQQFGLDVIVFKRGS